MWTGCWRSLISLFLHFGTTLDGHPDFPWCSSHINLSALDFGLYRHNYSYRVRCGTNSHTNQHSNLPAFHCHVCSSNKPWDISHPSATQLCLYRYSPRDRIGDSLHANTNTHPNTTQLSNINHFCRDKYRNNSSRHCIHRHSSTNCQYSHDHSDRIGQCLYPDPDLYPNTTTLYRNHYYYPS